MKNHSNQEIEKYYFESFQAHYEVPIGELEYTDKPDVIIRGNKVIGIEITNLYITSGNDPASEQVQNKRRLQTLEISQNLHTLAGRKKIELSVDFEPTEPIHNINATANALADLAKNIENDLSGVVNPNKFNHIPQLRFVYINSKEYDDPKWRLVQGHRVPSLSGQRLQEAVKEKSLKIKQYQPCDEYWLLVVVDFFDRAQDQEIKWPMKEKIEIYTFQQVIIYKPQFAQVVEIVK